MPVGRARLVPDSFLKITGLTVEDAGVYICQAENSVATVVANATLTVYGKYISSVAVGRVSERRKRSAWLDNGQPTP